MGEGYAINFPYSSDERTGEKRNDAFPYWFLGQRFFEVTEGVAQELSDWLGDPSIVSDWLVEQQEHMVFNQPLEVSPFASMLQKKAE